MGDFTNFMHFAKQAALERGENPDQANAEFEQLVEALSRGGPHKYWERSLEFESAKRDVAHLMRMAAIHARLERQDEAFHYLRQAMLKTPAWFSTRLCTDPSFDSLRAARQFQAIIAELWGKK